MTILGVDVSHWQDQPLPWAEWAGRVGVVVIQITHGMGPEPLADVHLANTLAAGYTCIGAYHWLVPGQAEAQAHNFLAAMAPTHSFAMLDIEEAGIAAEDVAAWCDVFDQNSLLPLVLYGNVSLEDLLGVNNPRYLKYGLLASDYGFFAPGTKQPPLRSAPPSDPTLPRVPRVGRKIGWQFAGNNGRLDPYAGAIDLSVWDSCPGAGAQDGGGAAGEGRHPGVDQNPQPEPVWAAGDVAVAVADPLVVFKAPNGAVHDTRPNYTSDIDVFDVSPDGSWLKVFEMPELWVRAADVEPIV